MDFLLKIVFILIIQHFSSIESLPDSCISHKDCIDYDPNSFCDKSHLNTTTSVPIKKKISVQGICRCQEWFFELNPSSWSESKCQPYATQIGHSCLLDKHCTTYIRNSVCDTENVKCKCRENYEPGPDNENCFRMAITTTIPTTTTTVITSTTTVTTTTTTEEPTRFCQGTDSWKRDWKIPVNVSGGNSTGVCDCPKPHVQNTQRTNYCNRTSVEPEPEFESFWICSPQGRFINHQPNFNLCETLWIKEIGEKLEKYEGKPSEATGFLSDITERISNAITESDQLEGENIFFGHELKNIFSMVQKVMTELNLTLEGTSEFEFEELENITKNAFNASGTLLTFEHPWSQLPNEDEQKEVLTRLLGNLEITGFEFSTKFISSDNSARDQHFLPFKIDGIELSSGLELKSLPNTSLTFPFQVDKNSDSYIELPNNWKSLVSNSNDDSKYAKFVASSMSSKHISGKSHSHRFNGTEFHMNGNFISISLTQPLYSENVIWPIAYKKEQIPLGDERVTIRFNHDFEAWGDVRQTLNREPHAGEDPEPVLGSATCAYWDTNNRNWDTNGCTLVKSEPRYTICSCDHLTGFAVLMDYHGYTKPHTALVVLTILLGTLSIICLIATILIFNIYRRDLSSMHNRIIKYLSLSLLVSHFLIILFLDKRHFNLGKNACFTFGLLTHFALLSTFSWMSICGAHLLKSVVIVFESKRDYWKLYLILGYLPPLIIVGITNCWGLTNGPPISIYGGAFCWLTSKYIWAFIGPIAVTILGNLVVLLVAIYKTINRSNNITNQKTKIYRKRIIGMISLSILLGLTWAIGFFQLIRNEDMSIVFSYIFTVLNGSQGIFIFLFNVVRNDKVRATILKKFDKLSVSKLSKRRRGRRGTETALTDLSSSAQEYYKKDLSKEFV